MSVLATAGLGDILQAVYEIARGTDLQGQTLRAMVYGAAKRP